MYNILSVYIIFANLLTYLLSLRLLFLSIICHDNKQVTAPEYVDNLMSWVEEQLNDEEKFPLELGTKFPNNFGKVCQKIFTRLFRVYAHMYHSHIDVRTLSVFLSLSLDFILEQLSPADSYRCDNFVFVLVLHAYTK